MLTPERAAYLRAIFDNLPTGVLVADDEAVYVDLNAAACEALGRTRDELLGSHVSDVVAPGRVEEVNTQWRSFIRDGEQSGLFEVEMPDGSARSIYFEAVANFVPSLHVSFLTPVEAAAEAGEARDVLKVCAWTRRVLHEGEWVTFETYMQRQHGIMVTHGMSPHAFPQID